MNQPSERLSSSSLLVFMAWVQGAAGAVSDDIGNNAGPNRFERPVPNILFIIMDDAGSIRSQLRLRRSDTCGDAGDRCVAQPAFVSEILGMPECSPSRAMFFEGRWPLRTNVNSAILTSISPIRRCRPSKSPRRKCSRSAATRAPISANSTLRSATNNPFGSGTSTRSAGTTSTDSSKALRTRSTLARAACERLPGISRRKYTCGFVPNEIRGGANNGSCRFLSGACQDMSATSATPTPGRSCLEQGGIFVPNQSCAQPPAQALNFANQNGVLYVGESDQLPRGRVQVIDPKRRPEHAAATSAR